MDKQYHQKPLNEEQIKFVVPRRLKTELQTLAGSRNISISALLRLIVSEYLRSKK